MCLQCLAALETDVRQPNQSEELHGHAGVTRHCISFVDMQHYGQQAACRYAESSALQDHDEKKYICITLALLTCSTMDNRQHADMQNLLHLQGHGESVQITVYLHT